MNIWSSFLFLQNVTGRQFVFVIVYDNSILDQIIDGFELIIT